MDQLAFQIYKGNSAADISCMTCNSFLQLHAVQKNKMFLRNPLDFR